MKPKCFMKLKTSKIGWVEPPQVLSTTDITLIIRSKKVLKEIMSPGRK